MFRVFLSLCFLGVLALTSCQKKVPSKACFTFSKSIAKVGDSIYVLNCSETYKKAIWYSPIAFSPSGLMIDSTHRHQIIVPTIAGQFPIILRIGEYDFYSTSTGAFSEVAQVLTVNP